MDPQPCYLTRTVRTNVLAVILLVKLGQTYLLFYVLYRHCPYPNQHKKLIHYINIVKLKQYSRCTVPCKDSTLVYSTLSTVHTQSTLSKGAKLLGRTHKHPANAFKYVSNSVSTAALLQGKKFNNSAFSGAGLGIRSFAHFTQIK